MGHYSGSIKPVPPTTKVMNEDIQFIKTFLENQGFSYYADLINEIIEENVKLKEINQKLMKSL